MLDQLVESKSHAGEDTRRGGLLLTTFVVMVTVLLSAYLYSLFAKDYGMGGDELSLETLVAPPVIEDTPEPEPEKQPEKKEPDVDVRKELIQNIMSSPVKPPEVTSVQRNPVKEMRLDRFTKIGSTDSDTGQQIDPGAARVVSSGGTGSGGGDPDGAGSGDAPPPPPPPPPPKREPPKTISGGVLNGKATSLPKPPYPPAARAVRASGAVSVQVLISESGSVISANAVSGHPLLRSAAESAAKRAHFSPTLLSGQPVKVSGVITYNFVP
ncbi:MAG: energy transducer TonB [Pyrinomonadaceae bacterium]